MVSTSASVSSGVSRSCLYTWDSFQWLLPPRKLLLLCCESAAKMSAPSVAQLGLLDFLLLLLQQHLLLPLGCYVAALGLVEGKKSWTLLNEVLV